MDKVFYGKQCIIDVGSHNGDDVDFYLKKGFKVVAIEANIELCNFMRDRFSDYIKNGILKIHNVSFLIIQEARIFI